MKERKGFIMSMAESSLASTPTEAMVADEKGQMHVVKSDAQTKNIVHRFLRPSSATEKVGPEPSRHAWVTLTEIPPGGSVDGHYHEYNNDDKPIFDIVYYVISGQLKVNLGDTEQIVGPDTMVYVPSNVSHTFTNVGKTMAKEFKVGCSNEGKIQGGPIYPKLPTYHA
jgi:mannose-6-phosphate isomerase-like protein (cupin superfamily)